MMDRGSDEEESTQEEAAAAAAAARATERSLQQQQHYLPARHPLHTMMTAPVAILDPLTPQQQQQQPNMDVLQQPLTPPPPPHQAVLLLRELAVLELASEVVVFPGDTIPLRFPEITITRTSPPSFLSSPVMFRSSSTSTSSGETIFIIRRQAQPPPQRLPSLYNHNNHTKDNESWLDFLARQINDRRVNPSHEPIQFGILSSPSRNRGSSNNRNIQRNWRRRTTTTSITNHSSLVPVPAPAPQQEEQDPIRTRTNHPNSNPNPNDHHYLDHRGRNSYASAMSSWTTRRPEVWEPRPRQRRRRRRSSSSSSSSSSWTRQAWGPAQFRRASTRHMLQDLRREFAASEDSADEDDTHDDDNNDNDDNPVPVLRQAQSDNNNNNSEVVSNDTTAMIIEENENDSEVDENRDGNNRNDNNDPPPPPPPGAAQNVHGHNEHEPNVEDNNPASQNGDNDENNNHSGTSSRQDEAEEEEDVFYDPFFNLIMESMEDDHNIYNGIRARPRIPLGDENDVDSDAHDDDDDENNLVGRIGTIVTVTHTHGDHMDDDDHDDDDEAEPLHSHQPPTSRRRMRWRQHQSELVVTVLGVSRFRILQPVQVSSMNHGPRHLHNDNRRFVMRYVVEELVDKEIENAMTWRSPLFRQSNLCDPLRNLSEVSPIPSIVWQRMWPEHLASQIRLVLDRNPTHQSFVASMNAEYRPPRRLSDWLSSNLPLSLQEKTILLDTVTSSERLQWILRKLIETENVETEFLCQRCGSPVSRGSCVFTVGGCQGTTGNYVNEYGHVHQTLTVRSVHHDHVQFVGLPETRDSWFPGYSWTIMSCFSCRSHLGWKFCAVPVDNDDDEEEEESAADVVDSIMGTRPAATSTAAGAPQDATTSATAGSRPRIFFGLSTSQITTVAGGSE